MTKTEFESLKPHTAYFGSYQYLGKEVRQKFHLCRIPDTIWLKFGLNSYRKVSYKSVDLLL